MNFTNFLKIIGIIVFSFNVAMSIVIGNWYALMGWICALIFCLNKSNK